VHLKQDKKNTMQEESRVLSST